MDSRPLVLAFLLALFAAVAPASAHDAHVTHRDTIQEVNFDFVGAIEGGETSIASGYGDAGLSYLPLRWCGTRRATDDTANQVHAAALPQVKFVYAHASDQEDRTLVWADLLQANASLISRFYAQQSDGQRAPRLDLGNDCGADQIDLATVSLPSPRSAYVDDFDAVEAAVDTSLPRTSARPRIYVILADKLSGYGSGQLWGQGSYYGDDGKGTDNYNNGGGVTSIIWIPQAQTLPTTDAQKNQGFWPEGFLHELTHNFGGVQRTSPNTTGAGHCRDGRDVMCYSDGGLSYSSSACPMITSFTTQFSQMLDCNRDDYFSPAPAATSWLGTHFNTFDNVFNGDCPALGNQCGGGVAPAVTGGPAIAGVARDGQTLTGALGTWSGDPALAWAWEEEVSGTWQPYAHTSLTLPMTSAHVGRRFRLKVTATGAETVVARSQPTTLVSAKIPPANEVRPSIAGTARNGETLTADPGTWADAASFAYQWIRVDPDTGASEDVPGATATTYRLGEDDIGLSIRLRVVATSVDGMTTTSTSTLLGPVVTAPISRTVPTVTGTAKVGRSLSSGLGTWEYVTAYAREWQREAGTTWEAIAGATASTYTLTAADAGLRVRLLVKATNANGTTAVASAPTSAVAALAPPVNSAEPVAAGTAQQGQTLTAQGDTWTGSPTTTVAWQRRAAGGAWTAIGGATARTYVLTAADVDSDVRAVVTAVNADGSATAASAARGPVVTNVPPQSTEAPAVSGVARTGSLLTATPGTWLRATSFAYSWQRLLGGEWTAIAGATSSTYTPVAADGGHALRVLVTATGPGGSTSAASGQTAAIADPPVLLSPPAISGTVKRGRTLTASPGAWEKASSFAYAWERRTGADWNAIAGATEAAYVPGAADVGHALRVRVVAANPTAAAEPVTSDATVAVADAPVPSLLQPPVVTGTLYVGETLAAAADEWADAASTSVRWQRRAPGGEWTAIAGANARTYTLTADDAGADVRAVVTALNEDGETPVASAPRGPVDADPANLTPPAVSGTARVGEALSATAGTWKRATTFDYAWQRQSGAGWDAIPGATQSTYTPAVADIGLPLRVVVTGHGSRATATAPSAATEAVVSPPLLQSAPSVSGTAKRGRTLTATSGSWSGATGFAYRWERDSGGWTPIDGATAATYVPGVADAGHALRVRVTASNATGDTVVTSEPTDAIADLQPPVGTTAPAISGDLVVGETLTATGDVWTGADATTVSWQRRVGDGAWTPIAAGRSYTLVAADLGSHLRVLVTATNADGEATKTSASSAPVVAPPAPVLPVEPEAQPVAPVGPGPQPQPKPEIAAPVAPRATDHAVTLRIGGKAAGKLTVTVTGTSATVTGARLKLRGAYTARFCAGRTCVTRKVKVAGGRLKLTGLTLPASTGAITVTLKPRRGKAAGGRLQP